MYVCLKSPRDGNGLPITDSISLRDALPAGKADTAITIPLADIGTSNFLSVLANQVDQALASAEVTLKVDVDNMANDFESAEEPDWLDDYTLDLCLSVTTGTNAAGGLDEDLEFQEFFPGDALARIKASINWPEDEAAETTGKTAD